VNPNRPLTREMLEELEKGHPSALIELVMRMQESFGGDAPESGALATPGGGVAGKASTRNRAQVETKWSGVIFAISRLERIQDNRLLVVVRVSPHRRLPAQGHFSAQGRTSSWYKQG
jgi:hypothetical protein